MPSSSGNMLTVTLSKNAMQINVAQLLKEPVGSTRTVAVEGDIRLDGDKARLSGQVLLTRLDRSILVSGKIWARLVQICSRCLREFETTTPFKLEEEYFPTIDINTGLPVEKLEEESAFTINANHVIDLTEALRQNLLVTLPMAPLCRSDCPGLCPKCGANLNEGDCGCNRAPEDSRWAKLKQLALASDQGTTQRKDD